LAPILTVSLEILYEPQTQKKKESISGQQLGETGIASRSKISRLNATTAQRPESTFLATSPAACRRIWSSRMQDLVMLFFTVVFFALAFLYVKACEKLR
jgi:hypothetical protein